MKLYTFIIIGSFIHVCFLYSISVKETVNIVTIIIKMVRGCGNIYTFTLSTRKQASNNTCSKYNSFQIQLGQQNTFDSDFFFPCALRFIHKGSKFPIMIHLRGKESQTRVPALDLGINVNYGEITKSSEKPMVVNRNALVTIRYWL